MREKERERENFERVNEREKVKARENMRARQTDGDTVYRH